MDIGLRLEQELEQAVATMRTATPKPNLLPIFERIDQLSEQLPEDDERGQDILGALYDYAEQIAP